MTQIHHLMDMLINPHANVLFLFLFLILERVTLRYEVGSALQGQARAGSRNIQHWRSRALGKRCWLSGLDVRRAARCRGALGGPLCAVPSTDVPRLHECRFGRAHPRIGEIRLREVRRHRPRSIRSAPEAVSVPTAHRLACHPDKGVVSAFSFTAADTQACMGVFIDGIYNASRLRSRSGWLVR